MGWTPGARKHQHEQSADEHTHCKNYRAGYIFVYLSYEAQSNNWVYFDDFKVTHTKTRVLQYNEYYPFGLQASTSWTREGHSNNFLYNEGTELNQTSGWYETMFRGYDATLGRFLQVDPKAEMYGSFSPYTYAANNPVLLNDPLGLEIHNPGFDKDVWELIKDRWDAVPDGGKGSFSYQNGQRVSSSISLTLYVEDPGGNGGLFVDYTTNTQGNVTAQVRVAGSNGGYIFGMMFNREVVYSANEQKEVVYSANDENKESMQGNGSLEFWNAADNFGDGISAFASPWALAGGIAEAEIIRDVSKNAAKAYKVAFSTSYQSVTKYNNVLGAAGKILGITGVITSGMVLWNDPNYTNLTKFLINGGSMFLKANPLGLTVSLGIGLLDYTGYLDKGLNYIYNENTGQ